jgi:RNA polymerase primary sigma factor
MKALRISTKITNRETGSFKQYLSEIADIEMFKTEEDEVACAERVAMGDEKAIDEMVKRNLRFVVSVAKQYEKSDISLEDLVNEGNIGLIMAVESYRPSTGFKFITYAVHWIRKMILEYLAKNGRIVRLPSNKITALNKYNQKAIQLEQKHGRSIDSTEIADELIGVMSSEEVNELEKISIMHFDSLDGLVNENESNMSMYEMIADDNLKPTDHLIDEADLKVRISRALTVLKPRDRGIMISLFGLDGGTPMTLKEVGEQVGLTREMVRQIREKSLEALKISFL